MRRHLASIAVLTTATCALGGSLTPPAGPVASTPGPEPRTPINATTTPGDTDSVFRISAPGSYYLTGNITGVLAKSGIEIAASGVTIDLMGFDLAGVPAMGAVDGITITVGSLTNIAVVNGSIRNWGDEGVDLVFSGAANCRVEGVQVSGNAGNGISVGTNSLVAHCLANGNSVDGISTGTSTTVTDCSASNNTNDGISAGVGSTVTNCSAAANTGDGLSVGSGGTIAHCSGYNNHSRGIDASSGVTVVACAAQLNTLDGIRCASYCVISGNTCSANGNAGGSGAGVHATGFGNRIEGNNCTDATRGIDVDSTGNIVIRNTCSGNATNWDIAVGNVVGPIIAGTTNGAVITGNTYAGSTGSTDPSANYTY